MKFGAALFASLVPLAALAANWPQYRGPQASGVDASKPVPIRWNVETGENILWQTPIPGLGHAAPIVWDDRVYVATAVSGAKADLKVGLYGGCWHWIAPPARSPGTSWARKRPRRSNATPRPATAIPRR
jgi:hypothetical protein